MAIEVFAPAKINLTLHVTGRQADGYHLLDSLVVFADIGDTIRVAPADDLSLTVYGPEAASLSTEPDNLVLRAARVVADRGARITLTKRLPVASGIGGGSADAAATLRALTRLWHCPMPDPDTVLALGADVPVCLGTTPRRMSGIGDRLEPVPRLPEMDILLVNPRAAVSTPAVFASLACRDNPPMPRDLPHWSGLTDFVDWLALQRNDLASPAANLCPEISEVLAMLAGTDALYAGMSGSGATCFALFQPGQAAARAASRVPAAWWCGHGKRI